MTGLLIFATRPSALARWQTRWVMEALMAAAPWLDCHEQIITTEGDKILDRPLPEIGGKGLFTAELEAELLSGRVQVAVHSLKDLPVEPVPGLTIGAIPARGEVRDVLISAQNLHLEDLPSGARVGTSSLRRSAQILARRPDLSITSLRGNVDTRIRKALEGAYDAILLAGAGVTRLGLDSKITQWLSLETVLPAPGQGALAIQCCADDKETLQVLKKLDDLDTRAATTAERAFLQALGGGCSLPVAAFAQRKGELLELTGLVASPDGKASLRGTIAGDDPQKIGEELAFQLLLQGAGAILNA
jgi:hydroxymethylbilane synthase